MTRTHRRHTYLLTYLHGHKTILSLLEKSKTRQKSQQQYARSIFRQTCIPGSQLRHSRSPSPQTDTHFINFSNHCSRLLMLHLTFFNPHELSNICLFFGPALRVFPDHFTT